ncbi:MAG: hypothetical protein IPP03_14760 [Dechloromonas sp.]|jgi:hypothetical protein|nr:hypothetical protein [Candidatus Dechloromonas phosphoritropha]
MTDKKKPHTAGTGTASKTTFDSRNHTKTDPLTGWLNLAKPSRDRQQKRTWKRNSRGRIDPTMAADIVLLAIAALLILGVIHA